MFQHSQVQGHAEEALFWGYFCFGLIIAIPLLMNAYKIHYIHVGRFGGRHPLFTRIMFLLNGISVFTPYFGHFNLGIHIVYLFSPIFTWKINPEIAAIEYQRNRGMFD
jgi:hypothetical protein